MGIQGVQAPLGPLTALSPTTLMHLSTYSLGSVNTNAYVLTRGAEALIIDAPEGITSVALELKASGITPIACWITHAHYDHILGAMELLKVFPGLPIHLHADGKLLAEHPQLMGWRVQVPQPWSTATFQYTFTQGQQLSALGLRFEVRCVPGHCPGSVLFYNAQNAEAFVGDAIFAGSIGRTDLPLADFDTLEHSIRSQIYTLPDATRLYPGHGGVTTVGHEKHQNPYVRGV